MNVNWSEAKAILLEVEQLFSRDDDVRDVADILKMQKEIHDYCQNNLKDAKDLIKDMTNKLAAIESDIQTPTEAEHAREIEKVISEKDEVNEDVENLRDAINTKREAVVANVGKVGQIRDEMEKLQSKSQLADARTSYALSLYGKISNITWDYSVAETSSKLTGYIGNDHTHQLRKFEIDRSSKSQYQQTNELWELIGQSC